MGAINQSSWETSNVGTSPNPLQLRNLKLEGRGGEERERERVFKYVLYVLIYGLLSKS